MKNKLRRVKKVARGALLINIFSQNEEELKETASSIFILSLTLLFISLLITSAFVFISTLPIATGTRDTLRRLDNYSIFSTFFLVVSTMLTLIVKAGALESYRPRLIWFSFILILVSIIMIIILFASLVFGPIKL